MQFIDPSLPRDIFGWYSPRLGMDMPIVRYGDFGPALLLFPTAQADFLEYERFFLIKALEPLIFQKRLSVFSIDSINRHAWMNDNVPAHERVRRQTMFSGYVEEEVAPHIRRVMHLPHAKIAVAGASFGCFHAANQFFRRPDLFGALIAMSGFFDVSAYTDGYRSSELYFNNPAWFVRGMSDVRAFRDNRVHIVTGSGEYERPEISRRFSELLWSKGIWNDLDIWGPDMRHDWPTWRAMLPYCVEHKLGW